MTTSGSGRAYERYAWVIVFVSAILGLLAALLLTFAPNAILTEPGFRVGNAPLAIRSWGVTWIGFSVFVLVTLLRNYRKGERWAWYVLWLLPLLWLSHFILAPDTPHNLVLAIISALGLILSYRVFFPASAEQPSRVS